MANMNDRYMEEYEAARSGRPSIQETLTKAQEQERKKKRHRYEKIGAALLVLIGALSWYFFYSLVFNFLPEKARFPPPVLQTRGAGGVCQLRLLPGALSTSRRISSEPGSCSTKELM